MGSTRVFAGVRIHGCMMCALRINDIGSSLVWSARTHATLHPGV